MTMPRPFEGPAAAVVIPLSQLNDRGEPVVVRRPGRPRRVAKAPTIDEREYHEAVYRSVAETISIDSIVAATMNDDPIALIEQTMHGVACEAAALLWDREQAQRQGRPDVERISARRVGALMRLADLVVAYEQAKRDTQEPDPQHVAHAVQMITTDVEEVIEDVAPPETAAKFLRKLHAKLLAAGLSQESVSTPTTSTATT